MPPLQISHAVGPDQPPVRDITVGSLLREAVAAAPDRIALIEGIPDASSRRQWTYTEFLAESERVARALLARHEPGDRVAIWAHNIPEWLMVEFGCSLAGVVLVTINPAFRTQELAYVLKQSRSQTLFVVDNFRGSPMQATAEEVQPDCPDLAEIISFSDWDDFISSGDPSTELPTVTPDDPIMIQYTSGTTGFPKGAYLKNVGLANNGHHTGLRMGVEEGGVFVVPMPLFHTGGSVCCTLGAVGTVSTIVLVEAFDPGLMLELMETYACTAMLGVPTMLVAMIEHPTFASRDLSTLEAVCSGGSLVPAPLVKRFEEELGAPFTIVFGQTECSPVASMTNPTDTIDDKAGTIGPPMPGVEVKIVSPGTNETLPVGEIGEYCTRGYHVMTGYFEMPDRTAEAIDADGWLHTGDLCAMDDRGYCTVEGRIKDMIIRGGENIYPRELEDLLFEHDAVGEVAVIGLPDDKWGETVAAFVRPAPGHAVDKNELFAYARDRLAPHKTPKHWFSVTDFPLTGSGKIQKFKLREQWQSGDWSEL
ncbi:MAG: AMP-binding protein [Acidimicrobiia bacterium]